MGQSELPSMRQPCNSVGALRQSMQKRIMRHRAAAGAEGVAEDVVGDDVELLLVLALDVGRARQARQVADARPVHQARDLGCGKGLVRLRLSRVRRTEHATAG